MVKLQMQTCIKLQILNLQKRLQTSITTFNNEANAAKKAEIEKVKKELAEAQAIKDKALEKEKEDELKRLESIKEIQDEFKALEEDEKAETEIQKIELEQARKLQELVDLDATESQKADIIAFYDKKILKSKEKSAKDKEKLEQIRKKQTLTDAKNTFNQIAELAGKDSKVGKALAIASATISGVEGVQNAYTTAQKSPITTFFPAYPIVQAALAGAVAAKNIATIRSVNPTGRSGASRVSAPSPSTPSTPAPQAQAQSPNFGINDSTGVNQLAQSIGGQAQRPVRTFVVASDVTSAQSLDRNIISGASIG